MTDGARGQHRQLRLRRWRRGQDVGVPAVAGPHRHRRSTTWSATSRDHIETVAPNAGRLVDPDPNDFNSPLTQAFAVSALNNAGSDKANSALSFLLAQQCTAGFFRSSFSAKDAVDQTCDGASPRRRASTPRARAAHAPGPEVQAGRPEHHHQGPRLACLRAGRRRLVQRRQRQRDRPGRLGARHLRPHLRRDRGRRLAARPAARQRGRLHAVHRDPRTAPSPSTRSASRNAADGSSTRSRTARRPGRPPRRCLLCCGPPVARTPGASTLTGPTGFVPPAR